MHVQGFVQRQSTAVTCWARTATTGRFGADAPRVSPARLKTVRAPPIFFVHGS